MQIPRQQLASYSAGSSVFSLSLSLSCPLPAVSVRIIHSNNNNKNIELKRIVGVGVICRPSFSMGWHHLGAMIMPPLVKGSSPH